MTTKQQEREALDKIRKIVEALGEKSYIGTAFDGCFEDAEFNLNSDAAFSLKGRLEIVEEEKQKALDAALTSHKAWLAEKAGHDDTKNRLEHEKLSLRYAVAEADSLQESYQEMQDFYAAAQQEILELKAKLYDLMTAGA